MDDDRISYLCYQREVCPTTGTPHLQGYIQLHANKRCPHSRLQGVLGGSIAFKCLDGDSISNIKYCKKVESAVAGSFKEFGESRFIKAKKRKAGGDTSDYGALVEDIQQGMDIRSVVTKYPKLYLKHHGGIDKVHKLFSRRPVDVRTGPFLWSLPEGFNWGTNVVVHGEAGIGKSFWCKTFFPNPMFVSHLDDLKRFDPQFHGGILFDDMDFAHLPRVSQIHLADVTDDRSIHVRYGVAHIPAGTKKVFCTNKPDDVFSLDAAVQRRLTYVQVEKDKVLLP